MRISVYNLHNGGTGRADPLAEVLLAGLPDVVVATESTDEAVLARLASRLGMDLATAGGESGSVSVLTRGEMVHSINHSALWAEGQRGEWDGQVPAVLEAVVRLPLGSEMHVFGVELSAGVGEHAERFRVGQVRRILELTAQLRRESRPHVVAGTLHTVSPLQVIDPSRAEPEFARVVGRECAGLLTREGYADAFAEVNAESVAGAGTYSTQRPGVRLDYVFAHGVLTRSSRIETDRLATYASDHYPLLAELAWGCGITSVERVPARCT